MYSAAGVHPHEAADAGEKDMPVLKELLRRQKTAALGEIGLDYHYDFSPREQQHHLFRIQLKLARETGMPVIIHVREAMGDALRIIDEEGNGIRGVFHCFGGNGTDAAEVLARGFYISFTGVVTFKNFKRYDAVDAVPLERLLLETDAPYMAPAPFRGKRNEPGFMIKTAEKIAAVKQTPLEMVRDAAAENSRDLFGLGV